MGKAISMIWSPRAVRETALRRTAVAAIAVNAINGMAAVTAIAVLVAAPLLFTPLLVVAIGILFGPLAGFLVSSVYPRIERVVGSRFGGASGLDELYRIFAWSFFPVGPAALLYSLLMLPFKTPRAALMIALAVPSLVIALFAALNYFSNVIAVQQFTQKKGFVSLLLTFILFLAVTLGAIVALSHLLSYWNN